MFRNRNTLPVSIHTFTVALLLVETVYKGSCSFVEEQDLKIMDNDRTNKNRSQDFYHYVRTIETIEDDDPTYPYEQILQLVKETKRIIMSSNETEKDQLNLDRLMYTSYLDGDLSDSLFFGGGDIPFPPNSDDPCPGRIEYRIPRRLTAEDNKEYFIINVGKELKQQYQAVVCNKPKARCHYLGVPDGYTFYCETSFKRKRSFVSIPTDGEINLSQQRFRRFLVPDNCICSGSRNHK